MVETKRRSSFIDLYIHDLLGSFGKMSRKIISDSVVKAGTGKFGSSSHTFRIELKKTEVGLGKQREGFLKFCGSWTPQWYWRQRSKSGAAPPSINHSLAGNWSSRIDFALCLVEIDHSWVATLYRERFATLRQSVISPGGSSRVQCSVSTAIGGVAEAIYPR